MKIAIAGTGYAGLSNAILLDQHNQVVALDIVPEKVAMLNRKQSPIEDAEIEDCLQHKPLNFKATLGKQEAYTGADYVIIATPTGYDPETNYFNTSSIESVIQDVLSINPHAVMIIKSTVPVGYTAKIRERFTADFAGRPDFSPTAQTVGINPALQGGAKDVGRDSSRQESIRLKPDLHGVAEGVGRDSSRQESAGLKSDLRRPPIAVIHCLITKAGSDNFPKNTPRPLVGEGRGRGRGCFAYMKRIQAKGIEVIVYEPALNESEFFHFKVVSDLAQFKKESDVIVANRMSAELSDVENKVYTRDIFGKD